MVYYTGKPIEKGIRTTNHKQNRLLSANNDFREAKKQNRLLTQPFLILKALVSTFYYWASQFAAAIALEVIKYKAGKQFARRCQIAEKDNNCVNFWCRKSLGKLDHVPTSNKTDSFSILDLFYVKIKFLNERNCSKKISLIKIWYKISRCRL